MLDLDAAEHGRGEGGDRGREPDPEHDQTGEQLRPVVGLDIQPQQHRQPDGADERADRHEPARPVAIGQRPEPLRQEEHQDRDREQRHAGLDRRVAGHLLEEQDEEEEQDAQAGVHRQRGQVAPGEVAPLEQVHRDHRVALALLDDDEHGRAARRRRRAGPRSAGSPQPRRGCSISANTGPARPSAASAAPLKSTRGRRSGAGRSSGRARRVRAIVATASGRLMRNTQRHDAACTSTPPARGPITVAMPVHAVHEPIAAARSRSLKTATMIPIVLGTSTAPAMPCSARKPTSTPGSGAAAHISEVAPKAATPADVDPAAAEDVPQRAADQQKGPESEQVGLDDPLLRRQASVQVVRDRGQGDVDHRAVQERHPRPEDAHHEDQLLVGHGQ